MWLLGHIWFLQCLVCTTGFGVVVEAQGAALQETTPAHLRSRPLSPAVLFPAITLIHAVEGGAIWTPIMAGAPLLLVPLLPRLLQQLALRFLPSPTP